MIMRSTFPCCLAALLGCLSSALHARAEPARPTPLLEDNLETGRRTRIDASSEYLDAEFDKVLGPGAGFSTKQLEAILDRLRADLLRERPRATTKLILFLYPGRVDIERLKALPEIFVDMELVLDPCERTVCRDAVGRHIELVGRALGQPVLVTQAHRFIFKNLTLTTLTPLHDGETQAYRLPVKECIAAGARPGGGKAWLDAQRHADEAYEPICVRAIARHAALRRVSLALPPKVSRADGTAHVVLRIKGDRARIEQQVVEALAAALAGLRENPATPKEIGLEVEAEVPMGRLQVRRFRARGEPVALYLDGRLGAAALWSSYVEDATRKKGVTRLDFAEGE